MRNDIEVTVRVGVLKAMNVEQFMALQEDVLADGKWENAKALSLGLGDGALMVAPRDENGNNMIVMGIEKDGYTHS
jgi:hypothetical protein